MSTQPALTMQQPINFTFEASPEGTPKREICLDALRAATWIVCLEELLATGEPRSAVRNFYDELSDACWLARWMRENVVVDVEIRATTELITQLSTVDTMTETKTLQDILTTLTEDPFTNRSR